MDEQFCTEFRDFMSQFFTVWDAIGIHGEQRLERIAAVIHHLRVLLEEMIAEEEGLRKRLMENVEKCRKEMLHLSEELGVKPLETEENLTLLIMEKQLRNHVESLSKERHDRLSLCSRLRNTEEKLCQKLHMPKYEFSTSFPSKEELHELQQHVNMLQQEKDNRFAKYLLLKEDIIQLMKKLELSPQTALEREIVCEEDFTLSQDNLREMDELRDKLKIESQKIEKMCKDLWEKLQGLWNLLSISQVDRKVFLASYSGPCASGIKYLKEEIIRCETIRRENIQKFVEKMREELVTWWDKCYISEEERTGFTPFYNDHYTEKLMEEHDSEIEKMKSMYKNNIELYTNVNKWEQLWKRMLEFEKKANDPGRFNNRGGALLQEEKERNKIIKQLPIVERELKSQIAEWEKKENKEFKVFGNNFFDYIAKHWEQHRLEKENEKLERQRQKAKLLEEELTRGSRPTPAKRRMITTPSKTPNKLRRVGGQNSTTNQFYNLLPAVLQSPALLPVTPKQPRRSPRLLSSQKKTPNRQNPMKSTPGKVTPAKPKRDVLKERNDNQIVHSASRRKNNCVSPAPSLVSIVSYSEFTTDLLRDEENLNSTTLRAPVMNHQPVSLDRTSVDDRVAKLIY